MSGNRALREKKQGTHRFRQRSERDISAVQPIELSIADLTPSTFLSTFAEIRQTTKSREKGHRDRRFKGIDTSFVLTSIHHLLPSCFVLNQPFRFPWCPASSMRAR